MYSTIQKSCKYKNKELMLRFTEKKNSIKNFLCKGLERLSINKFIVFIQESIQKLHKKLVEQKNKNKQRSTTRVDWD